MSEPALEEARVVVYDPVHMNRQATVVSLYEVGFRDIETPKTIDVLRETLASELFDLVILETTSVEDEIISVIQQIRGERMGDNVFSLVLATAWALDDVVLERILRAGADDLLKRPFSINQIASRVSAFLKARKPFLVTGDYVGPNHFDGALATLATEVPDGRDVDVPNTLQGRTGSDRKYYDAKKEIAEGRAGVKLAMISLEVELMEAGVEALVATQKSVALKIDQGLLPPALLDRLQFLKASADRIAPMAEAASLPEVADLIRSMIAILPKSAKNQTIPLKAVLLLLPQMARAIRLCLDPDDTDRNMAREIIEKVDYFLKAAA